MKLTYLSVLFSLMMSTALYSQYYSVGADPFSTDWWQIKTEQFQIIFPAEYESQAQEFAAKIDYAYDYVAKSMQGKPRKLSIIIHTQSAVSNGLVSWAPRRMELWTTPSQDAFNYSQDWMEQLIIHETRHYVQENKMNQGLTKVLKVILGEQAEMVPLGIKTRQWFMEGDAVATETALSHSGRGRMPTFEQGLRALTLDKGKQSYDEAHLGTYHHYVPNHYEVGYHTIAVNRLYRDSAMFDRKMERIGRGFSGRGLRDNRKVQYYGFAIDYLEKAWQQQDSLLEKTPFSYVLDYEEDYYTYEFLQEDGGKLYAVRSSLSRIPEIVEIDSAGMVRVVEQIGWQNEANFSVKKGKLVYADILPDMRWEQCSYSDLFVKDLASNMTRRLTHNQVLQAPDISPDARQIVAQWTDGLGAYALRVFDASNGRIIKQLPNPGNQFYFTPKWSDDASKIVYVSQEKDKKSLKYHDLNTGEDILLVEGTYGEMAHPAWDGDDVYFSASYSGINNIYKCNAVTKEVTRVTSARFGANYPSMWHGDLAYANYTADGYRVAVHESSDVAGEALVDVVDMGLGLADGLTKQEGEVIDFAKAEDQKYQVENYSRFAHLLHFHSWFAFLPIEVDRNGTDVAYSGGPLYPYLSMMSQNKLSTSFLTATYNADPAESTERFKLSYSYEGLYPKLSLNLTQGSYDQTYEDSHSTFEVKMLTLTPSISLPLSLKKGVYSLWFNNEFFYDYAFLNAPEVGSHVSYSSFGFSSSLGRSKQSATRDLYSPMVQSLSFYVSALPSDLYDDPLSIALAGRLYFPGFAAHHSLQLGLNWQMKDLDRSNVISALPRGYALSDNSMMTYASADYLLPLAYPDFHLGSLLNIKRCAMGVYGDWATITDANQDNNTLIGAGGSLFVDVNFLRYEIDFRIGIQGGIAFYDPYDQLVTPANLIFTYNVF